MLISSEKTVVRHVELSDAAFIFQLVHSPGFIKYIGRRDIADESAAEAYIQKAFIDLRVEKGFSYYLVCDLQGEKLGIAGFLKKHYLQHPDFGFAFLPQFHRQGLAFESCQQILRYGVSKFSLNAIDAVTMHSNTGSIALLQKLGFDYVEDIEEPVKKEALRLYRYRVVE